MVFMSIRMRELNLSVHVQPKTKSVLRNSWSTQRVCKVLFNSKITANRDAVRPTKNIILNITIKTLKISLTAFLKDQFFLTLDLIHCFS
jgi:hypothetical protein